MQIQHDPVYVGYMLSTTENSRFSEFPTILVLSVLAVIVVASLVLFVIVRKRKSPEKREQP
jgi:Na+/H+ antiporter NhaD/arsenite permease-like protein